MKLFRHLTPLEVAAKQLVEAQVDLLTQARSREYHASMEEMLHARIHRLREQVKLLSSEKRDEQVLAGH